VAYKPRPVTIHARFNELVRWLETKTSGLRLRTLAVLDRGEYGWVEFAQHRPCADDDEVAEFYRRLGALLALLYALDCTDVHCENLVACSDQPVLVDLETLLHPTLPDTGPAADDPAAAALASSVDRITLLPRLLVGEHGALDVSGMGGDPDVRHPFDVVAWQADGTDEMRLVRRPTRFTGAENRPVNGDGEVDPGAYVEVLLSGFRTGYDAIVAHRADLLGPGGLLARCAEDRTRMVPRATRTYATLLDESTHPDLMRDALDRDRILDALWASSIGDDVRHRLVRHEIADLWEGDVPLFLARPGSRDLWTGDGEPLAGLLTEPSLARVVRKISGMGELDRYDQEWIIRASIATRAAADAHDAKRLVLGTGPAVLPDPDRLLAAARAIADQLVARAYRDGTRVNWLGLEALEGRHWMVRPLGAGFAHGYTGVALFLAQISALTGAPGYAQCARDAVRPVPKLLAGLAAEPLAPALVGCGGFEGLGGIAYALSRLAVLLGDAEIAGWVFQAVDLTDAASETAEHDGVAEGLAGCVAAMLAVHQATGLPAAWQTAYRCAQRLVGSDSMRVDHMPVDQIPVDQIPVDHMAVDRTAVGRGFAHGADGLGWALRRFAMAGGGEHFARAGAAILDRADGSAVLDRANGAAMLDRANGAAMLDRADGAAVLDRPHGGAVPDGWCQGSAGRVLARVGERTVRHGRPDLDAMLGGAPLANHSLCHGELGNLEPLIVATSRGDRSATTSLGARIAQVLGAIERYGARCGTPGGVDSPGLLTGLAGIGYGLLRVGFADRVPSVLLLEPDRV
jgi:type 2 lantibiotic biosynthesis protein LanM